VADSEEEILTRRTPRTTKGNYFAPLRLGAENRVKIAAGVRGYKKKNQRP